MQTVRTLSEHWKMGLVLENKLCCDPMLSKGAFTHSDSGNLLGHIWKYVKYVDLLTRPYCFLDHILLTRPIGFLAESLFLISLMKKIEFNENFYSTDVARMSSSLRFICLRCPFIRFLSILLPRVFSVSDDPIPRERSWKWFTWLLSFTKLYCPVTDIWPLIINSVCFKLWD